MDEQLKIQLIALVTKAKSIADKGLAFLRKYILLSFINSVWISYYFSNLFSLSDIFFQISFAILIVPTIIFFIFAIFLYQIKNFDKVLARVVGNFKNNYIKDENGKVGFFDLIKLGKDFRTITSLLQGTNASFTALANLGNPFLLTLLIISYFSTIALLVISVITGLFYII